MTLPTSKNKLKAIIGTEQSLVKLILKFGCIYKISWIGKPTKHLSLRCERPPPLNCEQYCTGAFEVSSTSSKGWKATLCVNQNWMGTFCSIRVLLFSEIASIFSANLGIH